MNRGLYLFINVTYFITSDVNIHPIEYTIIIGGNIVYWIIHHSSLFSCWGDKGRRFSIKETPLVPQFCVEDYGNALPGISKAETNVRTTSARLAVGVRVCGMKTFKSPSA